MAYNIRGKTLSTVIPQSLYTKYPNFVTFLDKYYEWARKSSLELNSYEGNLNLSSKLYGITSEFYVNREVTNILDKSFTVDFSGQRTFIPTEKIAGVRPLTSPLILTIGENRDYVFEKLSNPKLTFYYNQQYKITNSTGATVYIKDEQTIGSSDQYTTGVTIDGTTITITTTTDTPRLYYTVEGYDDIGIIDVEAVPAEFLYTAENTINTDLPDTSGYTNSIYGFGQIREVLFNPDYLVDSYDTVATRDTPDAFFLKYLESYGLGDLFSKTIRNRSSIDDFVRFLNSKGTKSAIKFFFQAFFQKDVELAYPGLNMLKSSDGDYFVKQKMMIKCTKPLELTRNRRLKGQTSGAYVTIESVLYNAINDFYEVFINKSTINGTFVINEGILVIDNTDASIEYDIDGTLQGIFHKADIIQPGIEYDKGEIISNTYPIEGDSKLIGFTVDGISTTGIEDTTITSGGTNYVVGDKLFFPKPTERVIFSATINATQGFSFSGVNNEYTFAAGSTPAFNITLEDDLTNNTLFTRDSGTTYKLANVDIDGINYTATDIVEGSPDVLTLPTIAVGESLTIQSGQSIRISILASLIVDLLTDTSFFDTTAGVTNTAATGYVSRVHATTGAIEEITLNNAGAGYRKRPTTASGITILTDGKTLTHPTLVGTAASKSTVTHPTHNSITHSTQGGFLVGEEVVGDISGASGTVIKEASTTSLQVSGVTEGNPFISGSQILEHSSQTFVAGRTLTGQVSGAVGTVVAIPAPSTAQTTVSNVVGGPFLNEPTVTGTTGGSAAFVIGETITQATTLAKGRVTGTYGSAATTANASGGVITYTTLSGTFTGNNAITGASSSATLGASATLAYATGEIVTESSSSNTAILSAANPIIRDTITGQVSGVTATVSDVVGSFGKGETVTGTNTVLTISGGTTFPVGNQLNQTILTHPAPGQAFVVGATVSQDTTNAAGVVIASATGLTHVRDLGLGTWGTGTDVVTTRTLTHLAHTGNAFTVGETLTQVASGTNPTGVVVRSNTDFTEFRDLGTATWNTTDNVTGGTSSVTLSNAHLTAVSAAGVTNTAANLDTVTIGKGIVAHSDSISTILKDVTGTFVAGAGLTDYETVAVENATISAIVTPSTGTVQSHDGFQTLTTNGSLAVGDTITDSAGSAATATIVSVDGDEYELTHPGASAFTVDKIITQGTATGIVLAGGDANKTLFRNLASATWTAGTNVTQTSPNVTVSAGDIDRVTFTSGSSFLSHTKHSGLSFTVGETITQTSTDATGTVLHGSSVDETVFKNLNTGTWGTANNVTGGTSAIVLTAGNLNTVHIGTSTIVIKEASKKFLVGNVTADSQTVAARNVTDTLSDTMLVTPATGRFVAGDIITGGTTGAVTTISTIDSLFTIGETVTQATSGATGKIVSSTDTRSTITDVAGTFNTANIVTGVSSNMSTTPSAVATGASANLSSVGENFGGVKSVSITSDNIGVTIDATVNLTRSDVADNTNNNAEVTLRSGYYKDYGKLFSDVTGYLSETSMKLTDSYRYQDFSYSIKSDLNYKDFAYLLKKLAHPAGMVFFNEFFIIKSFQQKLNKGVATATKQWTINIHKTSTTKLAHAAQTFTIGRKITGGTSGATGRVAIRHHRLLTTLDKVRGTFVAGETLTEEGGSTAVVAGSGVNDIDKLHLIFSASSMSAIKDFFVRYQIQRPYDDQFQWLSESVASFGNYISTGSHDYNNSNLISTYINSPINEKAIIRRDGVRGIPFQNFRQTEKIKTVTGTGTISFTDSSTVAANGPPGPIITVTGGSSDFINQCSPRDIITQGSHTLLVVAVASDTSLTAQRTSAAAGTITVSGQSYTIAQKRINELNNATFDDLIQHGYGTTIQDVNRQFLSGSELTMDQFKDVFAV